MAGLDPNSNPNNLRYPKESPISDRSGNREHYDIVIQLRCTPTKLRKGKGDKIA